MAPPTSVSSGRACRWRARVQSQHPRKAAHFWPAAVQTGRFDMAADGGMGSRPDRSDGTAGIGDKWRRERAELEAESARLEQAVQTTEHEIDASRAFLEKAG